MNRPAGSTNLRAVIHFDDLPGLLKSIRLGRQSGSNLVSGASLPKMGIFALPGGDYRRFGRSEGPSRKVQTGGKHAEARHWRAFLAAPERVLRTAEWMAGAADIELGNPRLRGFGSRALVFSVEGKGFETSATKGFDRATKSTTIPLELVQRDWRKIHSPRPSEALSAESPEYSSAQTSAKWRDFWGNRALAFAGAGVNWRRE